MGATIPDSPLFSLRSLIIFIFQNTTGGDRPCRQCAHYQSMEREEKQNGMYEVNTAAKKRKRPFPPLPHSLLPHVGRRLQLHTRHEKVGRQSRKYNCKRLKSISTRKIKNASTAEAGRKSSVSLSAEKLTSTVFSSAARHKQGAAPPWCLQAHQIFISRGGNSQVSLLLAKVRTSHRIRSRKANVGAQIRLASTKLKRYRPQPIRWR